MRTDSVGSAMSTVLSFILIIALHMAIIIMFMKVKSVSSRLDGNIIMESEPYQE